MCSSDLDDDEAFRIWADEIGVPHGKISRMGEDDNFWPAGAPTQGPDGVCGPCSEIFFRMPDGSDVEIWNLVFTQFNRQGPPPDNLSPLPSRNIDTGMGLERVAFLLQGKENMYEIDEVFPVIERASELTGRRYGADEGDDVRFRVVADHIRSALMLINDGVTPGNEARGYVLRRLLRRAIRSMRLLGYDGRSLPELLPVSRDRMKASYPEIEANFERISRVAYAEEEAFAKTLAAGTQIFDQAAAETKDAGESRLTGAKAFALHDTYGFPIDLTLEMASEAGLSVDEEGFRALMAEQRERAKAEIGRAHV